MLVAAVQPFAAVDFNSAVRGNARVAEVRAASIAAKAATPYSPASPQPPMRKGVYGRARSERRLAMRCWRAVA